MGMVKAKYIDHLEQMDQFKRGLLELQKFGKKTFKDSTGEWREQMPSAQYSFLDFTVEYIPHEVHEVEES